MECTRGVNGKRLEIHPKRVADLASEFIGMFPHLRDAVGDALLAQSVVNV